MNGYYMDIISLLNMYKRLDLIRLWTDMIRWIYTYNVSYVYQTQDDVLKCQYKNAYRSACVLVDNILIFVQCILFP